jgi:hypothetical protein
VDPIQGYPLGVANAAVQQYGVGIYLTPWLRVEINTGLGFLPVRWQQAVAIIDDNR